MEGKKTRDRSGATKIKREFEKYEFKYLNMNIEELHLISKDRSKPAHEIMYIKSIITSIEKGNHGNHTKIMEKVSRMVEDKKGSDNPFDEE